MFGRSSLRVVLASLLALVLTWTLVSPVAAEETPEAGSAETGILAVDDLVPPLESEVLDTTVEPAVWGRFDSSPRRPHTGRRSSTPSNRTR